MSFNIRPILPIQMNIFTGFSTKRRKIIMLFYYLCNRIKPMGGIP